jgi:hypothetical protein
MIWIESKDKRSNNIYFKSLICMSGTRGNEEIGTKKRFKVEDSDRREIV